VLAEVNLRLTEAMEKVRSSAPNPSPLTEGA